MPKEYYEIDWIIKRMKEVEKFIPAYTTIMFKGYSYHMEQVEMLFEYFLSQRLIKLYMKQ
jgi:hypothetical protein